MGMIGLSANTLTRDESDLATSSTGFGEVGSKLDVASQLSAAQIMRGKGANRRSRKPMKRQNLSVDTFCRAYNAQKPKEDQSENMGLDMALERSREKDSHLDLRHLSALQSGKRKLRRAQKHIVRAAAIEATKHLGLKTLKSDMQHCVADLRSHPACMLHFSDFQSAEFITVDFEKELTDRAARKGIDKNKHKARAFAKAAIPDTPEARIYMLLEDPDSSYGAYLFSVFMAVNIIGCVVEMVIKSLISPDDSKITNGTEIQAYKVFEYWFTMVFVTDYLMRFVVSDALGTQTKRQFLFQPLNICDLISVLPFFIELVLKDGELRTASLLRVARLLRLARVARLARLARGSKTHIFGPVAAVFTIIWGIYLRNLY